MINRYIGTSKDIFQDEKGNLVKYEDYKMLEKEAQQAYGEKCILELKNKKLQKENEQLKEDMQYLKDLDCDDETAITLRAYKIALAKCLNDICSRYEYKSDFFERWGNEYELAEGYTNILRED